MERPVTTDDPSAEARTRALEERTPRRRRARERAAEPLWRERPGGYDADDDPADDDPPSQLRTTAFDTPPAERIHGSFLGGIVLNRYRLERKLGAGGFGVVYLAFDEKLQREVAVKVIAKDGDEPVPARAAREARVAARLNHPGIVALYELGQDDHAVYLVSELVHGRTFADLMKGGALSDRDVSQVGVAVCDALAHAHERKVIHRDVKPQNVIVAAEPAAGAGFAKLTDFGIAHLAIGDPLTRTGDVVGTLAYMAPEQAEGERVSEPADVYSLALMLYEGWTGVNPVRGNGPMATARRLGTHLPPLRSKRRDLPVELGRMIDAALDPRPEMRPTLKQLRRALDTVDDDLSDVGGLVEPATLERFGITRVGAGPRPREEREPMDLDSRATRLGLRAAGGLAAGALVLAGLTALGPRPPFSPLAAAAIAALVTAVLPRIGWIAAVSCVIGWLGMPDANREGTALMLAAAAIPVPFLIPRAGLWWSVPAAAPLLGAAAMGPLYVAIAGLAATPWRRAGAGAAGFLWLAVAEALSGRTLLFGAPDGTKAHAVWDSSLSAAASDALLPLVTSPALAPMVVWAVFAALMPFFVRGTSLVLDVLGGAVWATGLTAAHLGLAQVMTGSASGGDARGALAGGVLALVAAVAAAGAGLVGRPVEEDELPPRMATG
jgi:hypothetical protein